MTLTNKDRQTLLVNLAIMQEQQKVQYDKKRAVIIQMIKERLGKW